MVNSNNYRGKAALCYFDCIFFYKRNCVQLDKNTTNDDKKKIATQER